MNSVFFYSRSLLQPDTVSSLEWWFCTRGSVGPKAPSVNCLSSSLPSNPRKRSSTSVTPQRLFTGLAKHNCICEREKKSCRKAFFVAPQRAAQSEINDLEWHRHWRSTSWESCRCGVTNTRESSFSVTESHWDSESVRRRGQRFLRRQILYVDGEVRGASELSQYASWEVQRDFVKQLKATNKLWKNWKQNRIFWIFGTFKIYCTTIYNEYQ